MDLFRDFVEVIEGRSSPDLDGTRRRTNSQGSKTAIQVMKHDPCKNEKKITFKFQPMRSRTSSQGSASSLRRKTLNRLHNRVSMDETGVNWSP